MRALPLEVPQFFRDGHALAGHTAQDPDVIKSRDLPALNDRETPEHYLDIELLGGRELPPTRSTFLKLCLEVKVDPKEIGALPYSLMESTERLAMAFAEHRRYPNNPHIRAKSLVYAGILAHYSGDLAMPLHTTIHHDGRTLPNGKSPRSGIHAKVDSLIEKLNFQPVALAVDQTLAPGADLLPMIVTELQASHAQIDRTYELEAQLPPEDGKPGADTWKPTPAIERFAGERARAATRFTASLYLWAWRKSETIKLPRWLEREER